jgi:hypothetical protein
MAETVTPTAQEYRDAADDMALAQVSLSVRGITTLNWTHITRLLTHAAALQAQMATLHNKLKAHEDTECPTHYRLMRLEKRRAEAAERQIAALEQEREVGRSVNSERIERLEHQIAAALLMAKNLQSQMSWNPSLAVHTCQFLIDLLDEPIITSDNELCGRCGHPALHHANFGRADCQIPVGCDCFEFIKDKTGLLDAPTKSTAKPSIYSSTRRCAKCQTEWSGPDCFGNRLPDTCPNCGSDIYDVPGRTIPTDAPTKKTPAMLTRPTPAEARAIEDAAHDQRTNADRAHTTELRMCRTEREP